MTAAAYFLALATLTLASCSADSSSSAGHPPRAAQPANTSDSTGADGAQAQHAAQNATQAGPAPGPAQ